MRGSRDLRLLLLLLGVVVLQQLLLVVLLCLLQLLMVLVLEVLLRGVGGIVVLCPGSGVPVWLCEAAVVLLLVLVLLFAFQLHEMLLAAADLLMADNLLLLHLRLDNAFIFQLLLLLQWKMAFRLMLVLSSLLIIIYQY